MLDRSIEFLAQIDFVQSSRNLVYHYFYCIKCSTKSDNEQAANFGRVPSLLKPVANTESKRHANLPPFPKFRVYTSDSSLVHDLTL